MCLGVQINLPEYSWLKILAMISKLKTLLKSIQLKKRLLTIFILTSKMTVSDIRTACLMQTNSFDSEVRLLSKMYPYINRFPRNIRVYFSNLYYASRNISIRFMEKSHIRPYFNSRWPTAFRTPFSLWAKMKTVITASCDDFC